MEKTIIFYKETTGEWYAYLPDYTGEKADLEMVCGADTMLNIYSQGGARATLSISTEPKAGHNDVLHFESLSFADEIDSGAYYNVTTIRCIPYPHLRIWLCPVTLFVFGEYPKELYLSLQ